MIVGVVHQHGQGPLLRQALALDLAVDVEIAMPQAHPLAGQAHAHGYGSPTQVNPGLKELEDQGLMWLIVGAAGFWFGAGLITGPLAWVFGNKLRARYRAMGMAPHGNATGAWIVGIATTVISVLGLLAVIALFTFAAGVLGFGL